MKAILFVDDHELLARVSCQLLRGHGYKADYAYNANEALAKFERDTFDVLVSDYRMAGMNGLELAKLVRQILTRFTRLLTSFRRINAGSKWLAAFGEPYSIPIVLKFTTVSSDKAPVEGYIPWGSLMAEYSDIQSAERRRFPRFACTGAAEIILNGRCRGWGEVSDISRGGCYIEIVQPLPVSSEAQLRLTITNILVVVDAKVRVATPLVGMAMEFVGMPSGQEEELARIIERISTPERPFAELHAAGNQHLNAALQSLKQAKGELQEAMNAERDYPARALQLTEEAISELSKAEAISELSKALVGSIQLP